MNHISFRKSILAILAIAVTGLALYLAAKRGLKQPFDPIDGSACVLVLISPELDQSYPDSLSFSRERRLEPLFEKLDEIRPSDPRGIVALIPQSDGAALMRELLGIEKKKLRNPGLFLQRINMKLADIEKNLPLRESIDCNRPTILTSGLNWLEKRHKKIKEARGLTCDQLEVVVLASESELACIGDDKDKLRRTSNNLAKFCPLNTKIILVNENSAERPVVMPAALSEITETIGNFLVLSLDEYEYLMSLKRHLLLVDATESTAGGAVTPSGLDDVVSRDVFTTFRARVPFLNADMIDYWIFSETVHEIGPISLEELQMPRRVRQEDLDKIGAKNTNLVTVLEFLKQEKQWKSVWIYSDFEAKPLNTSKTQSLAQWKSQEGCDGKVSALSAFPSLKGRRQLYLQYPDGSDKKNVKDFVDAAECLGFVVHPIRKRIAVEVLSRVCEGFSVDV